MNNNSKTHNMISADASRPKSKDWKRKNKAKAKASANARVSAVKTALLKGN